MAAPHVTRLDRGDGVALAYAHTPGRSPTLVFLPGFGSDMSGDKATMLAAYAAARGQACLRLDYAGHGASDGLFTDGTIGSWTRDALAVIDHATQGDLLLIGSSMGGWIALLVALARPHRVASLIGLAAAPDFTEDLIWATLPPAARAALLEDAMLRQPGDAGGERIITRRLIEEGRDHLLLRAPIALHCPVRLLHGQRDDAVPWEAALKLAALLLSTNVTVQLIKDANHRLSRPNDLALLRATIEELLR